MERIKQALEKARREASVALPSAPSVAPQLRAVAPQSLDALEYRQTRVVGLDPRHLEGNRIVAGDKRHPSSASFDILRTKLLQKMEEKGWRTVAVTSPTPGAGKTVVAINLALAVAQQADRTSMLVDFDLRRPKVARYLGLSGGPSLNDVFAGTHTLAEALVNPGVPRLVALPAINAEAHPAELLASRKVELLVKELRERYADRIVLFDLPPLLGTDDAMAVMPHVDCVLVVVGNGEATESELQECSRHLVGVELLGFVLNKADSPRKNYY